MIKTCNIELIETEIDAIECALTEIINILELVSQNKIITSRYKQVLTKIQQNTKNWYSDNE